MTMTRFKAGDEVTVVIPIYAANHDKHTHLSVDRLTHSGSRVVLSDGTVWRQDGRALGNTSYSRFNSRLISRADGLRREASQARAARVASLQHSFDDLVGALAKCRVADAADRAAKIVVAEEVISFLRDLSGAGDL